MIQSPKVGALRSRTPTSAGMKDVSLGKTKAVRELERRSADPKMQASMWRVMDRYFGITPDVAAEANGYVRDHLLEISRDNLKGQCTSGHSCKIESRERLQRLIDVAMAMRRDAEGRDGR